MMNATVLGSVAPKLLTTDTPIIILPALAKTLGIPEAAILQQIHYMSQQPDFGVLHDGHRWIYNTLEQWHSKLSCWSLATIERAIAKLKARGLIHIAQLNPHKSIRTNYYRIDYAMLADIPECAALWCCEHDHFATPESSLHHDEMQQRKVQQSHPQSAVMHRRTTRTPPPHTEGMDSRILPDRIPANCGHDLSKNLQENVQECSQKSSKKNLAQHHTTAELQSGHDTPIHAEPDTEQQRRIPKTQLDVWRQLRLAKLDIAADDPLLGYWISKRLIKAITQQILEIKSNLRYPQGWHTPLQLGLISG